MDGSLSEHAWATAAVADGFLQQRPAAGTPASFASEVRVLRDEHAIYVGAHLHDPRPDSIVARLARRDATVTSDWFFVYFDTFHDRRNAFGFGVNAAGVRRDVRIADDTREDTGWDAVWDAAVRRDQSGWVVEMRIPLSQLRYVPGPADQTWGVNFRREVARTDEVATWAPSPQGTARFVSDFGRLAVPGPLAARLDLELLPYVVSRAEHAPGEAGNPWRGHVAASWSAGADLRLSLGRGLSLAATVNPDFGQVEADPSELNLSAFESFFSERRPFFVEGADVFDLTYPSFPRLFHARRIGRAPQGTLPDEARYAEPAGSTRILAAAKVTGRTEEGWTVGLLDAVTDEASREYVREDGTRGVATVEPRANYAVARVARAFNDDNSSIGVLVTSSVRGIEDAALRSLHSSAWAGALDGRHRLANGTFEVAGSVMASHVRGDTLALQRTQRAAGHRFQRPDADHVEYDPQATSLSGFGAGLRVRTLGTSRWQFTTELWARSPGLELGDLGFQFGDGADVAGSWTNVTYRRLEPAGPFRRWSAGVYGFVQSTFGREIREASIAADFDAQFRNLWTLFVNFGMRPAVLSPEALRGGPALREDARVSVYAEIGTDPRRPVVVRLASSHGKALDAPSHSWFAEPSILIRPSDRTRVEASFRFTHREDPAQYVTRVPLEPEPAYIVGTVRQRVTSATLRVDHTFTPALSLQLWLQPFLAAAEYPRLREVVAPRAPSFDDRFHTFGPDEIRLDADAGLYHVDRSGDGTPELSFRVPDVRLRELRSNLVLRWEYRPGSTVFLVWGHDRSAAGPGAEFHLGRSLDQLFSAPGSNRVILKLSHRVGA